MQERIVDTPEDWKKGIIFTTDKMYSNTDCVFVEYHDCLHLTGFIVLKALQESCVDLFSIDMDELRILDLERLLVWYISRKNKNFLHDLVPKDMKEPYKLKELLDNYLYEQYRSEDIYKIPFSTLVENIVSHVIEIGFVKKVVVYAEEDVQSIRDDVHRIFGDVATVATGALHEVLKDIPQDTTYIFSDYEKVITLEECGKLDRAAVLLVGNYQYNYITDENGKKKPIVNLEYLESQHRFTVGYLNICE